KVEAPEVVVVQRPQAVGILHRPSARPAGGSSSRRSARACRRRAQPARLEVQCGHRFAARGISVAHQAQSLVCGAVGAAGFGNRRFTWRTSMKMANDTMRKLITALRNIP